MKTFKYISSALILCISVSCHKSEPEPDCGCSSKNYDQVTNVDAAYAGRYNFIIKVGNTNGSTVAYATLCKSIDTTKLINDRGQYNYKIYGKLRDACLPNGVHPILPILNISLDSLKLNK